jgi:hypothetical protein
MTADYVPKSSSRRAWQVAAIAAITVGLSLLMVGPFDPAVKPSQAAFPGANGKIAFVDCDNGLLKTVNPDGSGEQTLISTGGEHPSWSPDGSRIAYQSRTSIYITNADGTGWHYVT